MGLVLAISLCSSLLPAQTLPPLAQKREAFMEPLQVRDDDRGKSPSSHIVCHQSHLTLHRAAEDAEHWVSKEAPRFASISVLQAIKTHAENTDI